MDQHTSSIAHTTRSSPSYQSSHTTHHSPAYQSAPTTNPSSSYHPNVTHPTPNYQFAPKPHHSTSNQSAPMTQNSPANQENQSAPMTHGSTTNQPAPSLSVLRGRGKNKCYWEESETQLLIEVLQDMACDPLWKTDGGFRSNYMGELHRRILIRNPNFSKQVSPHIESKVKWLKTKFHIIKDLLKLSGCQWNDVDKKIACEREVYDSYCKNHKEAKGLWDVQFPYLNQLELVYGRDRATGAAVEGYGDAIHNMETEQNVEIGGDHLGEFHFSLSDDEENELPYVSQATKNVTNATREPRKQKSTYEGKKAAKKKKTPDMEARLEGIDHSFRMFVQGFNTNFGTMANAVANAMNDDNIRQKAQSEKMKDVLAELMKLNLPSGDVLQAADIFSANKDKIDIFLNLSEQLRVSYVLKLTGLASGN